MHCSEMRRTDTDMVDRMDGAVGVFGPGTPVPDSANQVLNALEKRYM